MDESQLRKAIDRNETRSHASAWVLVAGLVIEVVLAFRFSEGHSAIENWTPVVANALVALGVYGEIHFSGKAARAQKALQAIIEARLAEALDRASTAEMNLTKYLTPRRKLLAPHADRIAAELRQFERAKWDIGFGQGDGEQADIAWDIEALLAAAGWDQQQWAAVAGAQVNDRGPSRPWAGSVSAQNVEIHLDSSWRQGLQPAASALIACLNGVGVKTSEVNFNARNMNPQAIHVLIGPKG